MSLVTGNRLRVLRRRLHLTQEQVAKRARTSRRTVQRIEDGAWDAVAHGTIQRVADALGAQMRTVINWNGAALDRLVDAGHAELQNGFAGMLATAGWLDAIEVSFNHYGDRGRFDILAWHPERRLLLVVEVKTAIGDTQLTLGTLDMKVRLAPIVAAARGWTAPVGVVPVLVVADERQQHRIVGQHQALFARFALRGRAARAWLRRPGAAPTGMLLYLPMTNARVVSIRATSENKGVR